MVASAAHANNSVMYYLNTAFDYEIRNHIDLEINRLSQLSTLTEQEDEKLKHLIVVKAYMNKRRAELKI